MEELPKQFIDRVHDIVPAIWLDQVMSAYSTKRPTTFRINSLLSTNEEVESVLKGLSLRYERIGWLPGAYIFYDELRTLSDTDLYNSGKIYVQSLSSMLPPLLLDAQPDELVLDICAAPGSKTTQIAAMMQNSGKIIANDLSTVRLYKLAYNLKMQGVTNVKTRRGKGEEIWKEVAKRAPFDRVLADVPCSLEGRFSLLDSKSYDGWSERKVTDLANRMKYLLLSAIQSAKHGGRVVYSTCTLSPEENEGVVDWVIQKMRQKVKLLDAHQMLNESVKDDTRVLLMTGIQKWRGTSYHEEVLKTARILPNALMEGFFVAVFETC